MDYNDFVKLLKKHGYNNKSNVSDYWFANKREISKLPNYHNFCDKFSLQVRWKSEIGQACEKAIRNYITEAPERGQLVQIAVVEKPSIRYSPLREWPTIEFSKFRFSFNNCEYSLTDFVSKFDTSQVSGWDLRGIDLSEIDIRMCIIDNCNFMYSKFDKANFNQVSLQKSRFDGSSFINAKIGLVRMDKSSSFKFSNFSNAFLNGVVINDHNFGGISFTKPSYYELVTCMFKKILFNNHSFGYSHNGSLKHTIFTFADNELVLQDNKSFKRYLEWYRFIRVQLNRYKSLRISEKIEFVINVVLTKYWSSFASLVFHSSMIVLTFSLIYFSNWDCFYLDTKIPINYFTTLYFSASTFSSFGFGELVPKTNGMQFAVILEILSGYFILGMFVILISRKLDSKY